MKGQVSPLNNITVYGPRISNARFVVCLPGYVDRTSQWKSLPLIHEQTLKRSALMCHFDRCGPVFFFFFFLHAPRWNIKMFMLIDATLPSPTHEHAVASIDWHSFSPFITLGRCVICGQCATFFHSLLDPTSHKHLWFCGQSQLIVQTRVAKRDYFSPVH